MGLFRRKKKEEKAYAPEIPPLPEVKKGKETEAIKEAVGEDEEFEIPERKPKIPRLSDVQEEVIRKVPTKVAAKGERALFVKIEKYEDAIDKINEIREKLDEAENLLRSISELRHKEEEELSSWQKEIEEIKNMLMTVDQDIFED